MALELIDGPRIENRPRTDAVGISVTTPFRGMLAVRDRLIAELSDWLSARAIETDGPFFLRLHVVDMSADMDIEVGVVGVQHDGDDRVRPGALPAGDYALLAYRGSSLQANGMLLRWVDRKGLEFDVRKVTAGDAWGGRFEILRTDPRREPRKTRWTTELAFRLRDGEE
jgi:hypothetical protein